MQNAAKANRDPPEPNRPQQGSLEAALHARTQEQKVERVLDERAKHGGAVFRLNDSFRAIATRSAQAVGSPWTFILATVCVLGWAVAGPIFKFSDTWQLVINTSTTIITFLTIFLVQNTQNRDARAIHLKLDELLRSVKGARTAMVDLENATDEELDELQKQFENLRKSHEAEAGKPVESD